MNQRLLWMAALALAITALFVLPAAALAADATWVGLGAEYTSHTSAVTLNASTPYYKNSANASTPTSSGDWNAWFEANTHTLHLKGLNYVTDQQIAMFTDGSITIDLMETGNILSAQNHDGNARTFGIQCESGTVTVNGARNAALSVLSGRGGFSCGIATQGLTIDGVAVTCGTGEPHSSGNYKGVYIDDLNGTASKVEIKNGGSLNTTATAGVNSQSVGIHFNHTGALTGLVDVNGDGSSLATTGGTDAILFAPNGAVTVSGTGCTLTANGTANGIKFTQTGAVTITGTDHTLTATGTTPGTSSGIYLMGLGSIDISGTGNELSASSTNCGINFGSSGNVNINGNGCKLTVTGDNSGITINGEGSNIGEINVMGGTLEARATNVGTGIIGSSTTVRVYDSDPTNGYMGMERFLAQGQGTGNSGVAVGTFTIADDWYQYKYSSTSGDIPSAYTYGNLIPDYLTRANSYLELVPNCVVTLDHNGGSSSSSTANVVNGVAMPTIQVPTKTGHTFTGYYDSATGGAQYSKADGTSAQAWDKGRTGTLYAHWTVNTYNLTLSPNGGVSGNPASVTATYGQPMPSIIGGQGQYLPTRTGYQFNGYYSDTTNNVIYYDADGHGTVNWDKTIDTLYAHWLPYYTLALNADPASAAAQVSGAGVYASGTRVTAASTSNNDYSFSHWLDESGTTVSTHPTYYFSLTADTTLTAKFHSTPAASLNRIDGIAPGQTFTLGETVTFTAVGAGMDNTNPLLDDTRWRYVYWETNPSGNFATGATQSFSTVGMTPGPHTLTVIFRRDRYMNSIWYDTNIDDTKSVSFTLIDPNAGSTDAAPPKTGDGFALEFILGLCLVSGLGLILMRMVGFWRKRRMY